MILKYEIPDNLSESEIADAIADLPSWRREKAEKFRFPLDRYLCAKAYLLLKEGLENCYGVIGDVEFGYGEYGKPFLKDYPEIHFNISHCPKCVVCAIDVKPVGTDVEIIQYDENLAKSVLSESELERVLKAEKPEIEFTKIWTVKESIMKLQGTGLRDNLKDISPAPGMKIETESNEESGYILSIASE